MEEEKGPISTNSRVSSSSSPPPLPLPSAKDHPPQPLPPLPATAPASSYKREMFSVELKSGETTIVSWKKLLKEAGKAPADPDPVPEPVPAAAAASVHPTEGDLQDAPPGNRFSAVIEKIERLYMGEQSSDEEELNDIPDDDQYDTEDSFIDDAELDEYFQVDKLSTKHNGYFVNRGNLEKIETSSPPNLAPKKRRRDSSKVHSENNHEHIVREPVNTDNIRIKAAARSAPLTGKTSSSPANVQTNFSGHNQEGKILKNKVNTSTGTYKKRSAELTYNLENPSSLRMGKDVALLALETQSIDKHKASHVRSSSQVESQFRKLNGENAARVSTKVRRKERYGTGSFLDTNSVGNAYPMQAIEPSSTKVKQGSAARPKGTTLERAIRDFEKIVALYRPPRLDIQEEDSSQGVKRRLPQEVKQKLAKVARLSANQNKITEDEIIDRLMGTVGHLLQRKTLKRNMREMVELGITEKQQRADRFQQVKQEVKEMIQRRITLLKSKVAEKQDGSADDFQEVNGNEEKKAIRRYDMDTALEDKICDLYDLYIEGMDEDKVRQSKKLYAELAELWPDGYMDNYGIKDAIYKSKDRKRARIYRHKARDEERIKRKKMAMAMKVEESSLTAKVRSAQEKPSDSTTQVLTTPEKAMPIQTIAPSVRMPEPALPPGDVAYHHGPKLNDKARFSIGTNVAMDDRSKMVATAKVKKKIKRKPESDPREMIHGHAAKNPLTNASHQPKQNPQLPVPVVPGPSGRPTQSKVP